MFTPQIQICMYKSFGKNVPYDPVGKKTAGLPAVKVCQYRRNPCLAADASANLHSGKHFIRGICLPVVLKLFRLQDCRLYIILLESSNLLQGADVNSKCQKLFSISSY